MTTKISCYMTSPHPCGPSYELSKLDKIEAPGIYQLWMANIVVKRLPFLKIFELLRSSWLDLGFRATGFWSCDPVLQWYWKRLVKSVSIISNYIERTRRCGEVRGGARRCGEVNEGWLVIQVPNLTQCLSIRTEGLHVWVFMYRDNIDNKMYGLFHV